MVFESESLEVTGVVIYSKQYVISESQVSENENTLSIELKQMQKVMRAFTN